jgi:hypothetical protein
MKVEGQCHCGAVAFEAEVAADGVVICHCRDCQTLSGSPYRASVATRADSFRITRGQPKIYVKIAASGRRRAQAFCGDCGSPISASDADNPVSHNLRIGALRQRHELTAQGRIWAEEALSWSQDLTGLPAIPAGPER